MSVDGEIPLSVLPDTVLSAGLYGLRAATVEPTTGEELAAQVEMLPLGVGLTTRQPDAVCDSAGYLYWRSRTGRGCPGFGEGLPFTRCSCTRWTGAAHERARWTCRWAICS